MKLVEFVPVGAEEGGGLLDPLALCGSSPRHHLPSACQSFPDWTFQGVNAFLHLLFVTARQLISHMNNVHKQDSSDSISFHFWQIFSPDFVGNLEPCLSDRQAAGVKLCWPSGSALAEAGYNTLQASIQESSAWSPSLTANAAIPAALLGIPTHTHVCIQEMPTQTRSQTHKIGEKKTSWI